MKHDRQPRIVVGVDGSASSEAALSWAIGQAVATGAVVEALTAWEFPQFYGSMGWTFPQGEESIRSAAEQVLKGTVAAAVKEDHDTEVRQTVAYGAPAPVLLEAAGGASMLVVGNRGHGGFTGALLGSVGQHCAQHAPCPVVIVRGRMGS